jgi:hypothetical protein
MGRAKSPAEDLLNDAIRQAVTPLLKAAKFRKTGMNYHRRHGQTIQVVNIQVSHGSTDREKSFYVNVGVAFDAICDLVGLPILERPKEYECDSRGTRDRLGVLVQEPTGEWAVRVGQATDNLIERLKRCFEELLTELDQLDSPAAYRSHRWFERFRPKAENAQISYVLGDLDGALAEVNALAKFFADRQNANRSEWWIQRLGLVRLKAKADGQNRA